MAQSSPEGPARPEVDQTDPQAPVRQNESMAQSSAKGPTRLETDETDQQESVHRNGSRARSGTNGPAHPEAYGTYPQAPVPQDDSRTQPNAKGPAEFDEEEKIEEEENAWTAICDRFKTYDEDAVKRYQDEMDTMLILAGLLSAVLTAFLVESFPLLQPNSTDTTNQILLQISAQLGSMSANPPFINSTLPPFGATSPTPFRADRSAVRINILWFLSLVLSLLAAFLGILVKQWLRKFIAYTALPSNRNTACLRQFRSDGVEHWHMYGIIGALPVFLQIAVVMFLAGLLDFLFTLDSSVFAIVAALTLSVLVVVALSAMLPLFFAECPYKSPLGWVLIWIVTFFRLAWMKCKPLAKRFAGKVLRRTYSSWYIGGQQRKLELILEGWLQRDSVLTIVNSNRLLCHPDPEPRATKALGFAYKAFTQEPVLTSVFRCMENLVGADDAKPLLSVLAPSLGHHDGTHLLQNSNVFGSDITGRCRVRSLPTRWQSRELGMLLDQLEQRAVTRGHERKVREQVSMRSLLRDVFLAISRRSTALNSRYVRYLMSEGEAGDDMLMDWCISYSPSVTLADALSLLDVAIETYSPGLYCRFPNTSGIALMIVAHNTDVLREERVKLQLHALVRLVCVYMNNLPLLKSIPSNFFHPMSDNQLETAWIIPLVVITRKDPSMNIGEFVETLEAGMQTGRLPLLKPNPNCWTSLRQYLPLQDRTKSSLELLNLKVPVV